MDFLFSSYRFNDLEIYLLKRLERKYFNKCFNSDLWPEVYYIDHKDYPFEKLEEELGEFPNYHDIDYLGVYVYNKSLDSDSSDANLLEGRIFLFKDRIEGTSEKIAYCLELNDDSALEILKIIVLIHEFGHWYTHWCSKEKHLRRANNFNKASKSVKETMAQLTVLWALFKLNNDHIKMIKTVFEWLTERQSAPYQKYQLLGNQSSKIITIIKRYFYILDYMNDDFDFLWTGNKSASNRSKGQVSIF